jgi:hypothetical protein
MWPARILAAIVVLSGSVAAQDLFRINGIVTDTGGSPLPGAEIVVEGRAAPAVVADARGAFEIPNLPPGVYSVRVTLPGFRAQTQTVRLQGRLRRPIKFVLRVGTLITAQIPLLDPKDAARRADAIAVVRLDGIAPPLPCAELVVVSALHNATVLEVWKGKLPKQIQILETMSGSCLEEGRTVGALSGPGTRYPIGSDFIVLLSGRGTRYGGLGLGSYVFPVRDGTVSTDGFMGLADTMSLREFELEIRKLAR